MITARALAAWAGTDRLSALPALHTSLAARPVTPASALLALFVAGVEVPRERLAALDERLVEIASDRVRARVSVLPIGRSLLVCDRLDTNDGLDIVCWPDDSSYHLALCVPPGRRDRWLDLGCGSAFAPLLRPELASAIVGADLNPRASHYARLGAELSRIGHLEVHCADLGNGLSGSYALVSCNAPIPEPQGVPSWRHADPAFVERLFAHAARLVAPGGMVVVHAALDALRPVVADLRGERIVVTYTPPDVRGFGVAWWQPGSESLLIVARRLLTDDRPHLTHEDRLAAEAGTLAPG